MKDLIRRLFGLFDPRPKTSPALSAAIGRAFARDREERQGRGW